MASADVRAWYADTSILGHDPARLDRVLAWLGPEARARFERYRHDRDRRMFALGRGMARALVGRELGLAPAAWLWREGPHGRPDIASPPTSWRFNVSHSGDVVACVLADGRDVGVDVEESDRRAIDPALVARFCAPDEAAAIDVARPGWHDRFLTYWTLKEAYLKARGLGIAVHLADISFAVPPDGEAGIRIRFRGSLAGTDARWAFRLARPTPRHVLAVAVEAPDADRPPVISVEPLPPDLLP